MNPSRILGAFLKVFLLAAGIAALVWLWKESQGHEAEAKEDEVKADVAVQVAKVARGTVRQYITAYGIASPQPAVIGHAAGSARIMSALQGALAQAHCAEGQRVEKGALLFQLDSRMADAAVEKARQTLAFAEQTYARQQELMKGGSGAVKNLQEAQQQLNVAKADLAAATAQQSLLKITAPIAGTVTRLQARPGDVVDLTTVLAEVTDLDRLVFTVSIPSADMGRVKVGQPVELSREIEARWSSSAVMPATASADLPQAAVTVINPGVDPKTDLGNVLVGIPGTMHVEPGQFVQVRILVDEHKDRLVVPVKSVVHTDEGQTAIYLVEQDKAVRKPVQVRLREGDRVEVEGEGVTEGQMVVTVGAYALPDKTKVHVATVPTTAPAEAATKS